jgi:hypothetical protein
VLFEKRLIFFNGVKLPEVGYPAVERKNWEYPTSGD